MADQFRTWPRAELHLVACPFYPAYARYYDFLGLVVGVTDRWVSIQMSGVVADVNQVGQLWALRRTARGGL